jgi:agmatine deiminase
MKATPKKAGYHMPAEWEPHEGSWLAWPKNLDTFPRGILEYVEEIYVKIIQELQKHEKVFLLVDDISCEERVHKKLQSTKNIIFKHIKSVDVWTRDYAPIFVKNRNGKIAAIKWIFNAWGNKYNDLKADDETGNKIAKDAGVPVFRPGIILEGGSIDTNGKGILLTTEQCLLNKNRNKDLRREQIESYLREYLGVEKIIWLKQGIAGDDTDGHVDDFARFVSEDTVVCCVEEDPKDENYKPLKENFELLKKSGLHVVKLPMPDPVEMDGRRLPASYANFYIANDVVLTPIFNQKKDSIALEIIQRLFRDRKVIGIYASYLVYGFGGIHCITQQQPR